MDIKLYLQIFSLMCILYIIATLLLFQFSAFAAIIIERYFKEKEEHYSRLLARKKDEFDTLEKVGEFVHGKFN